MEDSQLSQSMPQGTPEASVQRRQKRRVSILGVGARILVAAGILLAAGFAGLTVLNSKPDAIKRQARERTFTVAAIVPEVADHSVNFQAFGSVLARREIAVRSQVIGEVIEVAPNLQAGNAVAEGALLLAVDSFDYDGNLLDAQAAYADANLSLAEARESLKLQQSKLEAAKTNLSIAERDFARAQSLNKSGSLTQKDVETRELVVSDRRQAVSELETSIFTQNAQIDRQRANVISARSNVDEAQRNLDNTRITAPFAGIIVSETVGLGSYVTANETLVSLYDPNELEVSFTISDQQYGQLLAEGLIGRAVTATWKIEPTPISVSGKITRTDAQVDSATGGVTMFARLDPQSKNSLRPGTFVEVEIAGPTFTQSLRIPETAIYEDDHFYTARDGRMARIDVEILIRDGETLIVAADLPAGEKLITTRLSQAGEGVKVAIEGQETAAPGARRLPPGAERRDDGTVLLPNGNILQTDGSMLKPDGTVISAEDVAKLRRERQRQGGR